MLGGELGCNLRDTLTTLGVVGLEELDGSGMGIGGRLAGEPDLYFGLDGHEFHPMLLLVILP